MKPISPARKAAARAITCAAALSVGAICSPAIGAPDKCDPDRSTVDRAIALRDSGQQRQAEAVLKGLLSKNKDNFGANFILGTIEISSGGASADAGLNRLVATERSLSSKDKECAKQLGWYSIYNSIGAQFYRKKNLDRSEQYLLQGYAHLSDMPLYTRRLILSNLGLLYFAKGDVDKSQKFYQEAASAGSADARKRLATIQRIKSNN